MILSKTSNFISIHHCIEVSEVIQIVQDESHKKEETKNWSIGKNFFYLYDKNWLLYNNSKFMKKLSKVANTAQKGSGSKKNSHMLKFESLFVVSKNKIVLILTIKFFFGKIRTLFSFVIEYFYMPIFKGNYSPLTQLFYFNHYLCSN